jgi:hypothetical protein
MTSFSLFAVTILKALVEIAAMSLLAQGAIAILSGDARHGNFAYRLFQVITAPVIKAGRVLTPRFIGDRYLGLVSFLILFWLWLALIVAKAYVCHAQGLACVPH